MLFEYFMNGISSLKSSGVMIISDHGPRRFALEPPITFTAVHYHPGDTQFEFHETTGGVIWAFQIWESYGGIVQTQVHEFTDINYSEMHTFIDLVAPGGKIYIPVSGTITITSISKTNGETFAALLENVNLIEVKITNDVSTKVKGGDVYYISSRAIGGTIVVS